MPFCHCAMWSFFKGNGRCKPSVDPPRYFSISSDGQRLKTTAWAPNLNRGSHRGWKAQSFWNFFSPWLSSSVSCFSPRQEELLISGALIVRRKQSKVRETCDSHKNNTVESFWMKGHFWDLPQVTNWQHSSNRTAAHTHHYTISNT